MGHFITIRILKDSWPGPRLPIVDSIDFLGEDKHFDELIIMCEYRSQDYNLAYFIEDICEQAKKKMEMLGQKVWDCSANQNYHMRLSTSHLQQWESKILSRKIDEDIEPVNGEPILKYDIHLLDVVKLLKVFLARGHDVYFGYSR